MLCVIRQEQVPWGLTDLDLPTGIFCYNLGLLRGGSQSSHLTCRTIPSWPWSLLFLVVMAVVERERERELTQCLKCSSLQYKSCKFPP